jgi:hypothetical protein
MFNGLNFSTESTPRMKIITENVTAMLNLLQYWTREHAEANRAVENKEWKITMRITIVSEADVESIRQAYVHRLQTMLKRIETLIAEFGSILIERQAIQERHRCNVVPTQFHFSRTAHRYRQPNTQWQSHYYHQCGQ